MDNGCQKTVHDEFVTKVNAINTTIPSTTGLVIKTKYNSDKQGLEQKIELVDWSRRLITTRKLQRLKAKFLVLLN